MLAEDDILLTLDNSNRQSSYSHFVSLGHPYSFLVDCRLNIFIGANDRWAIAAERLGYNPRGGMIELEIYYYGNCLINLEEYNGELTNYYSVFPIEESSFLKSTDNESLKPNAKYWLVRGTKVELSAKKQDYINNGIELKGYESNEIRIEEAARLVIARHRGLFRAREDELYKSIPNDLKKILVIDEWYHKDFTEVMAPTLSDGQIAATYEVNKQFGLGGLDFEAFKELLVADKARRIEQNQKEWEENRPGAYETWQQVAKVIAAGDTSRYKPTLPANTHWINWPESGSL